MPLIYILAACGILYLLQLWLYVKCWDKGLWADIDLGSDLFIFEGDCIHTEETLEKRHWLPLPWVYVKYKLNVNGEPTVYHSDMFVIAGHKRIRRKRDYVLPERGVYTVTEIQLISHDLFLSKTFSKDIKVNTNTVIVYPKLVPTDEWPLEPHQLMGEIASKRALIEDPYLFKGIRQYQPQDRMRDINFAASARMGEWMVNIHETTLSGRVQLIFGSDKVGRFYDPLVYEKGLRLCGAIAKETAGDGIPTGFISNAKDMLEPNVTPMVEPGAGMGHVYEMLGQLARLSIQKELGSCIEQLNYYADDAETDTLYIFVCPVWQRGIREAFDALLIKHPDALWIVPITSADINNPSFDPNQWKDAYANLYLWEV